jgi:hypothetical protein
MTIISKITAKMTSIKAELQQTKMQDKIQSQLELQKSLKNPVKGKGSKILENIGTELNQSGNMYKDCKKSSEAIGILVAQFSRLIGDSDEHQFVYKSDSSLLISIDGTFYEITSNDLKNSILKFARNAGLPMTLIDSQLSKLLIEGIISLWKKFDKSYSDKNRLLE